MNHSMRFIRIRSTKHSTGEHRVVVSPSDNIDRLYEDIQRCFRTTQPIEDLIDDTTKRRITSTSDIEHIGDESLLLVTFSDVCFTSGRKIFVGCDFLVWCV